MLSGLLNLNKPVGPTSFQVIARLRRLIGIQKIGHAGTLDPLASGVLPICIGRAVRLSEYLQADDKAYRAEVTLGVRTTTDDAEGEVTSRAEVTCERGEFESLLPEFTGNIAQVPPHYAAIKVAGRPMYALARKGTPVDLEPRQVLVARITVLEWSPPRVVLDIACGKGTYIRALARDLGERLGCGAHLSGLVRTQCGVFTLTSAVSLDSLEKSTDWREHLLPMDAGLKDWSRVDLDAANSTHIKNGLTALARVSFPDGTLVRAYDEHGRFFAILRFDAQQECWRPEKVFHDAAPLDER